MLTTLATLSVHTSRRIIELGAILGLLAGIALALRDLPRFRRYSLIVAGAMLVVCFALIIAAVHFGKLG